MKDKKALYFDSFDCFDNVICSIDMVRCRFFIEDIESFYDLFKYIDQRYQTDIYSTSYPLPYQKLGNFKYFLQVPVPAGNTTFNCFAGLYSAEGLLNVVEVEFNPNKCFNKGTSSEIPEFVLHWLHSKSVENPIIKRFDLACDFYGVPRKNVFSYVSDARMPSSVGSGVTITRSFGKHNKHGHLKVYNKTAESKLDLECTRIEVTLQGDKIDDFSEIERCFGTHYALTAYDDKKSFYDRLALRLFFESPDAFDEILASADPRTKKRYRDMISSCSRTLKLPSHSVEGFYLCSWLRSSLARCILTPGLY